MVWSYKQLTVTWINVIPCVHHVELDCSAKCTFQRFFGITWVIDPICNDNILFKWTKSYLLSQLLLPLNAMWWCALAPRLFIQFCKTHGISHSVFVPADLAEGRNFRSVGGNSGGWGLGETQVMAKISFSGRWYCLPYIYTYSVYFTYSWLMFMMIHETCRFKHNILHGMWFTGESCPACGLSIRPAYFFHCKP